MAPKEQGIQGVLEMISRKPLASLTVGRSGLLRNELELKDIKKIFKEKAPKAIMYGLTGGRNAYRSFIYPVEVVAQKFELPINDGRITSFYTFLQEKSNILNLQEKIDFQRFNLPAIQGFQNYHLFIRDVDLVAVVDISGSYPDSIHSIPGHTSRTDFDLFRVTPEMISRGLRNNTSLDNFNSASRIIIS